MAAILKIVLLVSSWLSNFSEILHREALAIEVTWHSKFRKFNMADGRHIAIVKLPHLNEKPCDFDEIWYTTAHLELDDSQITKHMY